MRSTKTVLIVILLGVLLLAIISGCGRDADNKNTTRQTNVQIGTEETKDAELSDPTRDWEPIETKLGRFRYPEDLFDYLETEQTESGNTLKVLFRAVIRDVKIDLFEFDIGGGEGEPVGKITGTDGVVRDLYLRFIELQNLSELSDGERNRVYAMQEALNFVLDHSK